MWTTWATVFFSIIALIQLQWITTRHDPTACHKLVKMSNEWDGSVATAIRMKAHNIAREDIERATFGIMSSPRGGECEFRLGDIQLVFIGILFVQAIRVCHHQYKCVEFLLRFCPKQRPTRFEPAPSPPVSPKYRSSVQSPLYSPPSPVAKTPTHGSQLRFKRLKKGDETIPPQYLQSMQPLAKITTIRQATAV
tara:strand:- start:3571 stop:4152 length:582 start_codon:yes stop_codon:yes gene_type:complete